MSSSSPRHQPLPPTLPQSQLQSQSRTSSSPRRSPTRSPTHSEASRKRKRDDGSAFSSATTDFAASTRDKTKALLYRQCFHCEMKPGPYSPMDVCHVIPKKSANVITSSIFLLLPSKLTSLSPIVRPSSCRRTPRLLPRRYCQQHTPLQKLPYRVRRPRTRLDPLAY